MSGETVDNGVVNLAPSDAHQAKPAYKMLGLRAVAAPADTAVPDRFEIIGECGELRGGLDVIADPDVAATFEKEDEPADTADIERAAEGARIVSRTPTPVPRKALDNRVIHARHRDAVPIEPMQKVSCRAAIAAQRPRCARAAQMVENSAHQRGDQGRAFHRRQQMIEEALLWIRRRNAQPPWRCGCRYRRCCR